MPKQRDHGDFATNVALGLASRAGRSPRDVAAAIADALPEAPFLVKVEVAGPGFLNLFTTDDWLHDALREVAERGHAYGRSAPTGRRVQVEFVSANPTGPLTLGHARNAAIGDALARLLEATGSVVEREYYFNDAGGQMDRFGASVEARFLELLGRDARVPEDGYHGAYVEDLARDILEREGPGLADLPDEERFLRMRAEGVVRVLSWIETTLERFGVRFDVYFRESELAAKGEIDAAVERLRERGAAYDAEGAVWFRSTAHGDDKDRVVVRSNGHAHVLRRRLRVHRRQVLPGLRSPRVRARRRPPRRRRQARGRGRGPRLRPRRARDRDLPVGLVPARRGTGPDGEALRELHRPRPAARRGRCRRRAVPPAALLERRDDQLRHRGREAPVDGQPRVLRAVRACEDRVDPREGRAGGGAPAADR